MSVFSPEQDRERREFYFEKNRLSPEVEKRLKQALQEGHESFPDVTGCPNPSCGYPLVISPQSGALVASCQNCGFRRVFRELETAILLAGENDLPPLRELQRAFYGESFGDYHADLAEALDGKRLWVAKTGEQVAGYLLCELLGPENRHLPNSVFLSELYVLPEFRSEGVGRRLIETALAADWPGQYDRFTLTHEPDEKHLTTYYERFGFSVIGRTDVGNVMMARERENGTL